MDQKGFGIVMTQEPILTARGLIKRYGRVTALDNADFDLYPGEILAVIGDNGAGKSSLIKAISGAAVPDEGEIRLQGKPVSFKSPMEAREAGIETVYQDLAVAPRIGRRLEVDDLAVELDLAFVGDRGARQRLDQRRLAGAVVADHCEDLAGAQFEVGAVQR